MAGIYLHIPFCTQRCTYCDFYFVTSKKLYPAFLDALHQEIEMYGALYGRQEPIETIYLGGGTPSLLKIPDLENILEIISENFDTTSVQEVTLELNPEDAHPEYLSSLLALGVNRLSVGIQSFKEKDLQFMNRCHDHHQSIDCIDALKGAGFDNWSLDLIFGVPGQHRGAWMNNLEKVVALDAPHLSTYGLTLEKHTPFYNQVERGVVVPATEQTMAECYETTMDYLGRHGYDHYEISSFARPGYKSIHNQRYWHHQNYLGLGPSAHSFWWGDEPMRWSNVRSLRKYITLLKEAEAPSTSREKLDEGTLVNEHILLRLRTSEGLDTGLLKDRFGVDLVQNKASVLTALKKEKYIQNQDQRIILTRRGKPLCDAITRRLLL